MERNKKIENIFKELNPIAESYRNMQDEGFKAKATIYDMFLDKLNNYCCSDDVNTFIDYAEEIYNQIDWENDDGIVGYKNQGYLIVIVYILNLFITENRKANYADFSDKKKDFARVMNIIKSFKVEQNNED